MNLEIISDLNQIARLKDRWNELSADRPFASWEWYHSWYQNLGSRNGMTPFVLLERTAGKISMIVPFYMMRSKFGANRLCLAGDGHTCTDYGQIISDPGRYSYSASKLGNWLTTFNRSQANIDFVEFDGLAAEASTTHELFNQFDKCGFLPSYDRLENCWALDLPETWDDLNGTFSKKHRRKTKKAESRLAGSRILTSQTENFDGLWKSLVSLHQKRRRAAGDAGCFANRRFEQFLKTATCGLVDRDHAEILLIESEGHPIAASVIFHDHETAFMYQSGFDPGLADQEPGYMLIVAALQWSIERGLKRFDFMRGNEPYKARWNAAAVPMVRLRFQLRDSYRTRFESAFSGSRNAFRSSLARLGMLAKAS